MESSTRNRIARVSIATVAVALAATTLASAAPSLDLSLPGAANRRSGDQTRAVEKATEGGRGRFRDHHRPQLGRVAAGRFTGIDALPLTDQTDPNTTIRRLLDLKPRNGR